jgi:uncharacterized protein involved in outer membrane biogenesis
MKKVLLFGVIALLVVAIAGYITMQFFLGSIVKAGVNKFGPSITQTRVELAEANISPLSGAGALRGLAVGNPKGWSNQDAFRLGKIQISAQPMSLLADHIVINELIIEQPEFLYETKFVASNIGDLLKNIEQSTGSGSAEPKTKKGQPIRIEIKHLVLREGRVTVGVTGAGAMTMPMPEIDMKDLGSAEGGITPAQLALAVMRKVTADVVAASTQALAKMSGTSGAAAVENAKQIGEAVKGLFGGKKK